MPNHKRHRPKNRRSGCLMCKWWKVNGEDRRSIPELRRDLGDKLDYGYERNR